jgi:hypothetical protein
MKYYLYHAMANDFASIGFDPPIDGLIVDVYFSDCAFAHAWKIPYAHGFEDRPKKKEGDFPAIANLCSLPVMSKRAWEALSPLIGNCCESLPIVHPTGNSYSIIHVMETIDCLDISKSAFTRNRTTGRINRIDRYAFKANLLTNKHFFKLPLECGADLILDDDFRKIVQQNGLIGLSYSPIPM